MQKTIYKEAYSSFFLDSGLDQWVNGSKSLVTEAQRVFFIGNGGSNAITSHMMEDFGKMLGKQTFSFTDPALITCYANDYGYEQAMVEWLKLYKVSEADLLIAISSSGSSMNIINAVHIAKEYNCPVLTLSGFKPDNSLRQLGVLNVYVPHESFGLVETLHQVFLHIVLDELYDEKD